MPLRPPTLTGPEQFTASLSQVASWRPLLLEVLDRHDLRLPTPAFQPGHNATYPTFLCHDLVIKLFGVQPTWSESYRAEAGSLARLLDDPALRAPRILATGDLFDDPAAPWPYLVMTRVAGEPLWKAALSHHQATRLAAELGDQVRRLHRLPTAALPPLETLGPEAVVAGARRSSFPAHLLPQIPDWLRSLGTPDPVLVHGDLVANHVYLEAGRLTGLIDWGDALVADRHFELGKLFFGALGRRRADLAAFLEASEWPTDRDFARRALGQTLLRQAKGLEQHRGFDVFDGLATLVDVDAMDSLDTLAQAVFAPA